MDALSRKRKADLDNTLAGQVGDLAERGQPASTEPDTADDMGAFEEDALTTEEALESRFDTDPE